MFLRSTLFVVSLLIATASSAQIVGGTISGTVLDPTGAVVPGAQVTIRNQETAANVISSRTLPGHMPHPPFQ
jgi:hypothetical protein